MWTSESPICHFGYRKLYFSSFSCSSPSYCHSYYTMPFPVTWSPLETSSPQCSMQEVFISFALGFKYMFADPCPVSWVVTTRGERVDYQDEGSPCAYKSLQPTCLVLLPFPELFSPVQEGLSLFLDRKLPLYHFLCLPHHEFTVFQFLFFSFGFFSLNTCWPFQMKYLGFSMFFSLELASKTYFRCQKLKIDSFVLVEVFPSL